MGKKRITGNDRALMMISRDIRRRWLQYGENRKEQKNKPCVGCGSAVKVDIDHIDPVGKRPYKWRDLASYCKKMFETECQPLCKVCHGKKTKKDLKKIRGKDEV